MKTNELIQDTDTKVYWRNYSGTVIDTGDHYETTDGRILYWMGHEVQQAMRVLRMALETEKS